MTDAEQVRELAQAYRLINEVRKRTPHVGPAANSADNAMAAVGKAIVRFASAAQLAVGGKRYDDPEGP